MDLEMASFENNLDKNPLFSINDSTVVMEIDGEKVNFDLDQITNVRVIKFRDLTLNVFLLVSSISFYLLGFKSFFVVDPVSLAISVILFGSSIFIRLFSYKLLINKGNYDFCELLVSKSNLLFAEHLASIIKAKK
jgi:hypothetical protein